MADPYIHSKSSVKKWGGKIEDYLEIHEKIDCCKKYMPSPIGRALTHTEFWIYEVMIPIFGKILVNSSNREVPVKDICERHISEDYGNRFIPTIQDFLENIQPQKWMYNGLSGVPNSAKRIYEK